MIVCFDDEAWTDNHKIYQIVSVIMNNENMKKGYWTWNDDIQIRIMYRKWLKRLSFMLINRR
jgi:hypothetical protein